MMLSCLTLLLTALHGSLPNARSFDTNSFKMPLVAVVAASMTGYTHAAALPDYVQYRKLLDLVNEDEDPDGARKTPNPVLSATPLTTQAAGVEEGVTSTITVVTSAAELYAALSQGSAHIELRDHVDLTSLDIDATVAWGSALLPEVAAGTQSITGSCLSLPTFADRTNITGGTQLRAFQQEQCLIVTDADIFAIRSGNLWLHNIYVRIASSAGRDDIPEITWVESQGNLYLSDVTMQGTGSDQSLAVDSFANVHAENCLFADFGPAATPVQIIGNQATAVFEGCTFASPAATREDGSPVASLVAAQNGAYIKLENSHFEVFPGRISALLYRQNGFIYSDEEFSVDDVIAQNPLDVTSPLDEIPDDVEFLTATDEWILTQREVLNMARAGTTTAESSSDGGISIGAIIGIVGGVIGVILLALLIVVIQRMRPRRRGDSNDKMNSQLYDTPAMSMKHGSEYSSQQQGHGNFLLNTHNSSHSAQNGQPLDGTSRSVGGSTPGQHHLKQAGTVISPLHPGDHSMHAASDVTNNSGSQLRQNLRFISAGRNPSNGSVGNGSNNGSGYARACNHPSQTSLNGDNSAGGVENGGHRMSRNGSMASLNGGSQGGGGSQISPIGTPGSQDLGMVPMHAADPIPEGIAMPGNQNFLNQMPRNAIPGIGVGAGKRMDKRTLPPEQFEQFSPLHAVEPQAPVQEVIRNGSEGVEDRLARIHTQLDSTGAHHLLHGLRFKKGSKSRLQGGQAVVQFATDVRTEREYAIKFFATREAFMDEASLYSDAQNPLNKLLPRVREICDNVDGRITDATGDALPPCIIMEKGEALNIWSRRNKGGLDHMTALQVLHHIAERLSDLHRAGYVHRDLKQSNVMWQPRRNRWTLIDFGLVATIGEPVQIGFSLAYAAPEIVRAYRSGENTVIAQESVDAWSLGILAVELFTNDVALDLMQGKEKVISMIVGESPLPWEDPATSGPILKRFGLFKDIILELLDRDPDARPSMVDFTRACRQVLALTTSKR